MLVVVAVIAAAAGVGGTLLALRLFAGSRLDAAAPRGGGDAPRSRHRRA